MNALGYARVSTAGQRDDGASLDAQRATIVDECTRRDWHLLDVATDTASGRDMARPGLQDALSRLDAGLAGALVVSKLDRLSRSLMDFANLLDRARRNGWAVVALDLGVDTATPTGELVASVMAAVASWERRVIGARTSEALAIKRAAGVKLGRPSSLPDHVRATIRAHRAAGASLQAIADRLNATAVPTAMGGVRWYPSSVRAVCRSGDARSIDSAGPNLTTVSEHH